MRFLLSEFESRQMNACDYALFTRDNDALLRIASQGDTFTSLYSRAAYLLRLGEGDEATDILRHVIEAAPLPIRGRALVTLGSVTFARGDLGEAITLFGDAQHSASDPLTALNVLRMNAVIQSATGHHDSALAQLGRAAKLAASIHPDHPVRLDFYNSVAVELIEAGHHREAAPLVKLVTSSPIASVYPDWIETARDLANFPSSSFVFVPRYPKVKKGKLIMAAHRFPDPDEGNEGVRFLLRRIDASTAVGDTESESVVKVALKLESANEEQRRVCSDVLESEGPNLELAKWAVRAPTERAKTVLASARKIDSTSGDARIGRIAAGRKKK